MKECTDTMSFVFIAKYSSYSFPNIILF